MARITADRPVLKSLEKPLPADPTILVLQPIGQAGLFLVGFGCGRQTPGTVAGQRDGVFKMGTEALVFGDAGPVIFQVPPGG